MHRILTLPEWQIKTPTCYRRRGESYWKIAEVPLDSEWVFILNTLGSLQTQTPAKSLIVVTIEHLMELLEGTNPASISSAYLIRRNTTEHADALETYRLSCIRAGDAEHIGWNSSITIDTDNGFTFTSPDPGGKSDRLVNEVEVFRFQSANPD